MKIKFCGATIGVTGSCHLLYTERHRVLLDCGQFQGNKEMDALNYEPFPFDPTAAPEVDTTLGAEERGIGGLGIFMVKKTMDDIRYEYRDGKNILTIRKTL